MTSKQLKLHSYEVPSQFLKFGIGFNSIFDDLSTLGHNQTDNYPPYNIVHLTDDEFIISLAVAGFSSEELTVTKEKNKLIVSGTHDNMDESEEITYVHRGISRRNFTRQFRLADHVDIVAASLELGILNVHLKREVPEEEKPKVIAITYNK